MLTLAVGKQPSPIYLYSATRAGDEERGQAVVHHIFTDIDPTYIVAVNSGDRSEYRVHGFADSQVQFEKLMAATGTKIANSQQADRLAGFYREVNPENLSISPIRSLVDLKQAAERQCQTASFDAGEHAFEEWWKLAKPLYSGVRLVESAVAEANGYVVEWTVLSSSGPGMCGGVALRVQLPVQSNGEVGEVAFSPLPAQ
jgi:hypothetical protein